MHHTNHQLAAKRARMKYMLQKYQCFICPKPLSPKRFSPSLFCLSPNIQVFSSLFSELLIVRNNMGPECAFAKYTLTPVLFPRGKWLIRSFHKDWMAHIHARLQGGVAGQLTSQGGRAKGPRWPGFKLLSSTQAVWPLAGYLTALCFYCLNCESGVTRVPPSLHSSESQTGVYSKGHQVLSEHSVKDYLFFTSSISIRFLKIKRQERMLQFRTC